jgi:chitodextrinase
LALGTGHTGSFGADVSLSAQAATYAIVASPRPVSSAVAGSLTSATAWVRSDTPGKRLCMKIQEYNSSGSVVGTGASCVTSATSWTQLAAQYTVQASGDSVALILVQSAAASGDRFSVDDVGLDVTTPTDAGPPTTPQNLTGSATSSSVSLAWDRAADDIGVTGYTVYRDGLPVKTVGGTSWTDASVSPSTSYAYTVDAFDAAGNHSAQSTQLSVTTAASSAIVALWHMDETSGTVMVDSAGSNDGTLHSVQLNQPGALGKAYGFNGSSSYVSVPSSGSLNPGSHDITLSAKVKFSLLPPGGGAADYDLLRKGLSTTAGGDYKMEIVSSGKTLCLFRGSGTQVQLTGGPNLANGAWHTISCEKTATSVRLIVDGAVKASKSATVGTISNSSPLYVGAKPNDDWYIGLLDEVFVKVQ